jgi:hypothetical protein
MHEGLLGRSGINFSLPTAGLLPNDIRRLIGISKTVSKAKDLEYLLKKHTNSNCQMIPRRSSARQAEHAVVDKLYRDPIAWVPAAAALKPRKTMLPFPAIAALIL